MSTFTTYQCDAPRCANQTTDLTQDGWTLSSTDAGRQHFCPAHRSDRPAMILVEDVLKIVSDVEKRGWLKPGQAELTRSAVRIASNS